MVFELDEKCIDWKYIALSQAGFTVQIKLLKPLLADNTLATIGHKALLVTRPILSLQGDEISEWHICRAVQLILIIIGFQINSICNVETKTALIGISSTCALWLRKLSLNSPIKFLQYPCTQCKLHAISL